MILPKSPKPSTDTEANAVAQKVQQRAAKELDRRLLNRIFVIFNKDPNRNLQETFEANGFILKRRDHLLLIGPRKALVYNMEDVMSYRMSSPPIPPKDLPVEEID